MEAVWAILMLAETQDSPVEPCGIRSSAPLRKGTYTVRQRTGRGGL